MSAQTGQPMTKALSGVIVLDKPTGITSNQALGRLKRLLGQRKMGFLGTLDPLATGVLPVFLGKATRLIPLFEGQDKRYQVTIRLGEETDSYDSDGKVLRRSDIADLTADHVREAILAQQGDLEQRPPAFSAIKRGGVPAYRAARQGLPVHLPSRRVRVWAVRIEALALPEVAFALSCSAGTYVRSIAHDIGQSLGTGAVVTALRRISSGEAFQVDRAATLEQIEAAAGREQLDFVLDPALLLTDHMSYPVDEAEEHRLNLGQVLTLCPEAGTVSAGARMKAVRACGTLVAIGEAVETGTGRMGFRPSKVLT